MDDYMTAAAWEEANRREQAANLAENEQARVDELDELRDIARELAGALEFVSSQHHDTLTPSNLHNPHSITRPGDCPAGTCKGAVAALARWDALSTPEEGTDHD